MRDGAWGVLSEVQTDVCTSGPSMIAHIYPEVLQAVSGRDYAGCLDGCF
jgi:hypothetical protein